jgi:hypothetical protein
MLKVIVFLWSRHLQSRYLHFFGLIDSAKRRYALFVADGCKLVVDVAILLLAIITSL